MSTVAYQVLLNTRKRNARKGDTCYWKYIKPEEHYIYENPDMAQPSECVMLVPSFTFEQEI